MCLVGMGKAGERWEGVGDAGKGLGCAEWSGKVWGGEGDARKSWGVLGYV